MSKDFSSETYKEVSKEYGAGQSEFFRPEEGENKIRILSGYEPLAKHWIELKGKRTNKVCFGKDKGCSFHEKEDLPVKVQFVLWVLDRKDQVIKLYEAG